MKRTHRIVLWIFLGACARNYPEGVYPCTTAADCPTNWVCRAEMRCWSTALDAGTTNDAASADSGTDARIALDVGADATDVGADANDAPLAADGGPDAPACAPIAETCDGLDNDCDAIIDESLATVSSPVVVPTGGNAYAPAIVSRGLGAFGLLFQGPFGTSGPTGHRFWTRIDATGTAAAAMMVGTDYLGAADVRIDGTTVVSAESGYLSAGTFSHEYDQLAVFSAADGSWVAPSGGLPYSFAATHPTGNIALADASGGRATVYAAYGDANPRSLHRYRMSVGATPSILASTDAATMLTSPSFAVQLAGANEHAVASESTGLFLYETPAGDATGTTTRLGPVTPTADAVACAGAVRDRTAVPSPANPLVFALLRPAPAGIEIVVLDGVAPVSAHTLQLPASVGARTTTGGVAVVAAPGGGAPRFYVAALDGDAGNTTTLRAWELTTTPLAARALGVTGDWNVARSAISIASSGNVVRLVENDGASGLVTRTIGCH